MSVLKAELQALSAIDGQLGNAIEKLNEHILKTEAALGEFSCATASIPMPEATAEELESGVSCSLDYAKENGKYELLLVTHYENEQSNSVSLSSASLKNRVEAVKLLPELVRLIANRSRMILDNINTALNT